MIGHAVKNTRRGQPVAFELAFEIKQGLFGLRDVELLRIVVLPGGRSAGFLADSAVIWPEPCVHAPFSRRTELQASFARFKVTLAEDY